MLNKKPPDLLAVPVARVLRKLGNDMDARLPITWRHSSPLDGFASLVKRHVPSLPQPDPETITGVPPFTISKQRAFGDEVG